jgi:hypothetical protein
MRTTTIQNTKRASRSRRLSFALGMAALAGALSPTLNAQATTGWLLPISDETSAQVCPFDDEAVTMVHCTGAYCDNVEQYCQSQPEGQYYERWRWAVGYTSDEYGPKDCTSANEGTFGAITGMSCTGSYCDNMRIECGYANHGQSDCGWTNWVSEEGTGSVAWTYKVARSLQCSGSYCDSMRFYVCTQS